MSSAAVAMPLPKIATIMTEKKITDNTRFMFVIPSLLFLFDKARQELAFETDSISNPRRLQRTERTITPFHVVHLYLWSRLYRLRATPPHSEPGIC
jgi:hypothetical protein